MSETWRIFASSALDFDLSSEHLGDETLRHKALVGAIVLSFLLQKRGEEEKTETKARISEEEQFTISQQETAV